MLKNIKLFTIYKACHAILKGAGAVAWQSVIPATLVTQTSMADDFTSILRDEFKRFIEELPNEDLRQSTFTEELEVADRLLARSERICREFVFFLRSFESRNCDISEDITELIKQLLKLYEGLTERYRERVNWLEKDRGDNSFRCQPEPVDEGNARSRGRPRFSVSKSQLTVPRLKDAKEKHKFAANHF